MERRVEVGRFFNKYSNVVNIVATPLLTVFLWLFYIKGRYNYIEHLVANMYFVGFTMLFYAFVFFPILKYAGRSGQWVIGIFFLFEILYRGFAYYHFNNRKGALAVVKAYGFSLAVSLIWFALTSTIIGIYIRTGFGR